MYLQIIDNHGSISVIYMSEKEAHSIIDPLKAEEERKIWEQEEKERNERKKQLLEEQYNAYILNAENFMRQKDYIRAKKSYFSAIQIKPEEERFISGKIDEIDEILLIMNERKYKVYDYEAFFHSHYKTLDEEITERLKEELFKEKNVPSLEITITASIDTVGTAKTAYHVSGADAQLKEKIAQIADRISLRQPFLKDYTVASKAEFTYTAGAEEAIIKVKKNAEGLHSDDARYNLYKTDIHDALHSAPMGKFTLQVDKVTINGQEYVKDQLLEYKGTGGASNAFLSLLVPGLGDSPVTSGKTSGFATGFWAYTFIGAGVGCKLWSNSEYKKYHSATEQSVMDDHYKKANRANQAFYACAGIGALIWVCDIIWVWNKGAQNEKAQKIFKQSHLGFYYQPEWEASGLTDSINF